MKTIKACFYILCILAAISVPVNAQLLYGAATGVPSGENAPLPSSLYLLDPATGGATLIGPIGFDNVTGLAFLGDGRLVGSANGDTIFGSRTSILIEIDPVTGAGALIGIIGQDFNDGCGRVPDITYDPSTNSLYGWGDRCPTTNDDRFLVIDQNTGAGTIIGPTGFEGSGNGLAVNRLSGEIFAAPGEGLYTVDPTTGAATLIPATADNVPCLINALDFQPGTNILFGSLFDVNVCTGFTAFGGGFHLVTIDTVNGSTANVGLTVPGLDAIVFQPESEARPIPAITEWGMIAMAAVLGIIGYAVYSRRMRTA
jgi:hypothetical protein